tara:strand:- start:1837 stop:2169 length:333 start_codon:yes stop_codon:yes gene_type:complete
MNDLNEKFNFLKSKKYEKSNHPGVEVFYDKQTFLKINKKTKITITPGNVLFIIKKSFGLKEGALKVIKESELHNETNSNMYCVLTDCLFSEKETDSKIFIRSGDSEKALI